MMGRLGARLVEGLPDDVLWMSQVSKGDTTDRLSRSDILDLRVLGLFDDRESDAGIV